MNHKSFLLINLFQLHLSAGDTFGPGFKGGHLAMWFHRCQECGKGWRRASPLNRRTQGSKEGVCSPAQPLSMVRALAGIALMAIWLLTITVFILFSHERAWPWAPFQPEIKSHRPQLSPRLLVASVIKQQHPFTTDRFSDNTLFYILQITELQ